MGSAGILLPHGKGLRRMTKQKKQQQITKREALRLTKAAREDVRSIEYFTRQKGEPNTEQLYALVVGAQRSLGALAEAWAPAKERVTIGSLLSEDAAIERAVEEKRKEAEYRQACQRDIQEQQALGLFQSISEDDFSTALFDESIRESRAAGLSVSDAADLAAKVLTISTGKEHDDASARSAAPRIQRFEVANAEIETTYRDPKDMAHLGSDAIHYAWSAMFTTSGMQRMSLKGCPAGSGPSKSAAVADLLSRAGNESGVRLDRAADAENETDNLAFETGQPAEGHPDTAAGPCDCDACSYEERVHRCKICKDSVGKQYAKRSGWKRMLDGSWRCGVCDGTRPASDKRWDEWKGKLEGAKAERLDARRAKDERRALKEARAAASKEMKHWRGQGGKGAKRTRAILRGHSTLPLAQLAARLDAIFWARRASDGKQRDHLDLLLHVAKAVMKDKDGDEPTALIDLLDRNGARGMREAYYSNETTTTKKGS